MAVCLTSTTGVTLFKIKDMYDSNVQHGFVTVNSLFKPMTEGTLYIMDHGLCLRGIRKEGGPYITFGWVSLERIISNETEKYVKNNAASRIQRYWKIYIEKKRQNALVVIRPALIHWAYKPDGPLGRRVIESLIKNNTDVLCVA